MGDWSDAAKWALLTIIALGAILVLQLAALEQLGEAIKIDINIWGR